MSRDPLDHFLMAEPWSFVRFGLVALGTVVLAGLSLAAVAAIPLVIAIGAAP